jgi:FAD/FMN-containing dehydrogenase
MKLDGRALWRDEDGYEEARTAAVWNGRKPDRYPDVIVQAASENDVVAAVRYAIDHDMKVKARGGGHAWTGSALRSGMMIDLSRLKQVSYDPATARVRVQPGVNALELDGVLAPHDRFFPYGHCPTVGIGGYLLQGGWGWNGRTLGPACMSIVSADVVTADGELIRADANQNTDFLWAVRGTGPGFFGIVTGFELQTHPRTGVFQRLDVYSMDDFDTVLEWALELEPTLPSYNELLIFGVAPMLPDGTVLQEEPALLMWSVVFTNDEQEAHNVLGRLDGCPALPRAIMPGQARPSSFADLYQGTELIGREGVRWSPDNMWTNAPVKEFLPLAKQAFLEIPRTLTSHIMLWPWRVHKVAADEAAVSIQGRLYMAAFSAWAEPADDDRYVNWPVEQMRRMESISEGITLGDENLISRPARFLSPENEARLEELRRRHDPSGRFHSYLLKDDSA